MSISPDISLGNNASRSAESRLFSALLELSCSRTGKAMALNSSNSPSAGTTTGYTLKDR